MGISFVTHCPFDNSLFLSSELGGEIRVAENKY
jgi:hypothetical protein